MTNHKDSFSHFHRDERAKTRLRSHNVEEVSLVKDKQTDSFIRTDSKRKREAMKKSTIGGF